MFFAQQETQCPVFETGFTASEIQEISSLFEPPTGSPNSGSEGSTRVIYSIYERKRRRMISNRESARRSRWRKKRNLENLTVQLNLLEIENRELKNRLGIVLDHCRALRRENNQLTAEYLLLHSRLSDLNHVLVGQNNYHQPFFLT